MSSHETEFKGHSRWITTIQLRVIEESVIKAHRTKRSKDLLWTRIFALSHLFFFAENKSEIKKIKMIFKSALTQSFSFNSVSSSSHMLPSPIREMKRLSSSWQRHLSLRDLLFE